MQLKRNAEAVKKHLGLVTHKDTRIQILVCNQRVQKLIVQLFQIIVAQILKVTLLEKAHQLKKLKKGS